MVQRNSDRRSVRGRTLMGMAPALRGARSIDPGQADLETQMAAYRSCDVMVVPGGAAMANMIFTRPGTTTIGIVGRVRPARPLWPSLAETLERPYVQVPVPVLPAYRSLLPRHHRDVVLTPASVWRLHRKVAGRMAAHDGYGRRADRSAIRARLRGLGLVPGVLRGARDRRRDHGRRAPPVARDLQHGRRQLDHEVRRAFGASDLASYLTLSLDWRDGDVTDANLWIRRLWPPGVPAVLTALDVLPGTLIVTGAVAAVVAWAGTAAGVAALVAARGRIVFAAAFAILWAAAPMTLTYAWGYGLLFGDGLGVMLVVLVLVAVFVIEEGSRRGLARWRMVAWGMLAGSLLAGALYVRWALAVSVGAVLLLCAAVLVVAAGLRLAGRTGGRLYPARGPARGARGAALLVFLVAVAPWAAYRYTVVEPGSRSWVTTDFLWGQRWLTDEDLLAIGGDWLVPADANWSCDIDPAVCEELRPIALAERGRTSTC